MTKQQILELIFKTTQENNGIPLGIEKFSELTGIKRTAWEGKYWIKWSDAIQEAGLIPNQFSKPAYDIDWLLEQISEYIIELNHYPTQPEFKIRNHNNKEFPVLATIKNRLGNKHEIAEKIVEFCKDKPHLKIAHNICADIINQTPKILSVNDKSSVEELGYVYLMKSGKFYKIGKSYHTGNRNYQLGIQLPEKIEIIHEISTDDPSGIEKYWHNRFADKRKNGEWFELTSEDVNIFKKRKFM